MQPETFLSLLARANGVFPAAFPGKGMPALPLAIGTAKALFAAWPALSRKTVRTFMAVYSGALSFAYCRRPALDIVKLVEAAKPAPRKRGPYKKEVAA